MSVEAELCIIGNSNYSAGIHRNEFMHADGVSRSLLEYHGEAQSCVTDRRIN